MFTLARSESEGALRATFLAFAHVMERHYGIVNILSKAKVVFSDRCTAMPRVVRAIFSADVKHVVCLQHIQKNIRKNAYRLRGLSADDRRLAINTLLQLVGFLAFLPGPFLFGYVMNACLLRLRASGLNEMADYLMTSIVYEHAEYGFGAQWQSDMYSLAA
eukprot:9438390-Karenia_brevis.AAC.1